MANFVCMTGGLKKDGSVTLDVEKKDASPVLLKNGAEDWALVELGLDGLVFTSVVVFELEYGFALSPGVFGDTICIDYPVLDFIGVGAGTRLITSLLSQIPWQ